MKRAMWTVARFIGLIVVFATVLLPAYLIAAPVWFSGFHRAARAASEVLPRGVVHGHPQYVMIREYSNVPLLPAMDDVYFESIYVGLFLAVYHTIVCWLLFACYRRWSIPPLRLLDGSWALDAPRERTFATLIAALVASPLPVVFASVMFFWLLVDRNAELVRASRANGRGLPVAFGVAGQGAIWAGCLIAHLLLCAAVIRRSSVRAFARSANRVLCCEVCGYPTAQGSTAVCPECGAATSSNPPRTVRLSLLPGGRMLACHRRLRTVVAAAVVLGVLALLAGPYLLSVLGAALPERTGALIAESWLKLTR